MGAVDTNILVRLITRDNRDQTIAAEAFIEAGAWVSLLALAETIWVLSTSYKLGPEDQVHAVEMLIAHQDLVLQDADVVASALSLFRSKPKLGFTDCLLLEIARKAGHLPLGTFDRSLAKADGAHKL